jgi:hypothetical protein
LTNVTPKLQEGKVRPDVEGKVQGKEGNIKKRTEGIL